MRPGDTGRRRDLLPEDLDLVRRDANLPGLETLLDPEAFAVLLNDFLPDAELVSASPLYARYKPQMNLLLQHEVVTSDGSRTTVYAKAYGPDAPPHLEKVRRKPGIESEVLRTGRFVEEDLRIVISPFPNDANLKQLRHLANGKGRRILRSLGLPDSDAPLETLRYKPERRYVARRAGDPGAVVKFYAPRDFEAAQTNALSFSDAFRTAGPLRIPPVTGESGESHSIATGWVEGDPLEIALRSPSGEAVAWLAGSALAYLHAQETHDLRFTTRQEEVNELTALASGIAFTLPDVAEEVYAVVGDLAPALLASPLDPAPVHGDFYDEQGVVSPDREWIAILDLDRAIFGDPTADPGNFAAHLEMDVLFDNISAEEGAKLEGALLDGYEWSGNPDIRSRIALYKAIGLLKLAPVPFRRRWIDWPQATRRIVRRAGEIITSL